MKTHKHQPTQKLEKMRGIFFQIGFIVACSLTLLAFEWTFPYKIDEIKWDKEIDADEIIIDNTYFPEEKKEKPVVKKEQPQIIKDKIKIIKNDTKENENNDKKEVKTIDEVLNQFENTNNKEDKEENPFVDFMKVEYLPVPIGVTNISSYEASKEAMDKAILKHLSKHLRFPQCGRNLGRGGVVLVDFKIDANGNVVDVKVAKSTNKCFEEEAVKVVKSLPKFKPAVQNGKPVGVKMQLPIKFSFKS
jgi:protein TonB